VYIYRDGNLHVRRCMWWAKCSSWMLLRIQFSSVKFIHGLSHQNDCSIARCACDSTAFVFNWYGLLTVTQKFYRI